MTNKVLFEEATNTLSDLKLEHIETIKRCFSNPFFSQVNLHWIDHLVHEVHVFSMGNTEPCDSLPGIHNLSSQRIILETKVYKFTSRFSDGFVRGIPKIKDAEEIILQTLGKEFAVEVRRLVLDKLRLRKYHMFNFSLDEFSKDNSLHKIHVAIGNNLNLRTSYDNKTASRLMEVFFKFDVKFV
jgi:hypothetical protein